MDGVDEGKERVRSKPVRDECSQKEEGVPIWALRWGPSAGVKEPG